MRMLLIIVLVALTGCGKIDFEDVSGKEPYSGTIGRSLENTMPLIAHGVTEDIGRGAEVDYFVLTTKPGFSGPEVIERFEIAPGTHFRIMTVLRGKVMFSERVVYVVDAEGQSVSGGKEYRIQATQHMAEGNLGLPKNVYRVISKENQ